MCAGQGCVRVRVRVRVPVSLVWPFVVVAFHGMDDAILFPSCFDANAGLFEALLGAEDAVRWSCRILRRHVWCGGVVVWWCGVL